MQYWVSVRGPGQQIVKLTHAVDICCGLPAQIDVLVNKLSIPVMSQRMPNSAVTGLKCRYRQLNCAERTGMKWIWSTWPHITSNPVSGAHCPVGATGWPIIWHLYFERENLHINFLVSPRTAAAVIPGCTASMYRETEWMKAHRESSCHNTVLFWYGQQPVSQINL